MGGRSIMDANILVPTVVSESKMVEPTVIDIIVVPDTVAELVTQSLNTHLPLVNGVPTSGVPNDAVFLTLAHRPVLCFFNVAGDK